ncbi:MAG: hypothetical protein GC199_11260 [Alphaproteobacteria bacterium]|nr:hypothetical protein [Alphaproteobacteria bacterium]
MIESIKSPVEARLDGRWYVRVGADIFGPYTGAQMLSFVAEGRVQRNSIVALEGAREWTTAAEDAALSPHLREEEPAPQAEAQPAGLVSRKNPRSEEEIESSNFVIIYPQGARSVTRLEQTIMNLGPACKLSPHTWLVSSRETAGAIRNMLTEYFGRNDCLLVVDASRGKAAWFNFGPELEARMRRVWQRGDRASL